MISNVIKNLKLKLYFFLFLIFFSNNLTAQSYVSLENLSSDKNKFLKRNEAEGKIIKSIKITILDISGLLINQQNKSEPGWIGKLANSYHYKTRDWVVRSKLLFDEGDTLNPKILEESERILRSSGAFKDARIRVQKNYNSKKYVNVLVIVQEKWTLSLLISYNTTNKNGYAGLNDENFLGLGHKINLKLTHNEEKSIGMGGEFSYTAKNIKGTFIDAGVNLKADQRSNYQSINFSRPFITTYITWSGALNFNWSKDVYEYIDTSGNKLLFPYKENVQDIWIGKSFELNFLPNPFIKGTKYFLGFRTNRHRNPVRPATRLISYRIFENYTQYLFNFAILRQSFYKDTFIDKFGITEDVPIGSYISLTAGKENREFSRRGYYGVELLHSKRIKNFGYASADFQLGGFRYNGNWEQNVLNLNLIYHSELARINNWKYRFFLQNDILYGFNRFEGEQIYLNSRNGIRGLEKITLYGTKKITLNLEGRLFTPFSPLGFSLGGIVFADFGIISNKLISLSESKLYQSYGIGIRTRNESIVNADFSISLAYIPINNRTTAGSFKVLFSTNINLGTRDFGFGAPSIFSYGNN